MAARIVREDIDRFFDYGLHASSRTVYIGSHSSDPEEGESGTDYKMAEHALKALHILDLTAGGITVFMNNIGGDWYHGMAIYDAIAGCRNEVRVVGYGNVMSMGGVILQAADVRVLAPNAALMVHYGEDEFSGHALDLPRYAAELERCNQIMETIFVQRIALSRPGFNADQFRKEFCFDNFLSPKQAISWGLADEILQ